MFGKVSFGDKRLLVELRRIANAAEIIAQHYAKVDGRMWNPRPVRSEKSTEEAEVLHTYDEEMLVQQLLRETELMGKGWQEKS
jgi:hypothetical protein